jgi:sec-independent protein translocase protein TatB
MFGIGMPELMLIFVLALLVFGPKELPRIARTLGKAMAELRRASDDLRDGIQREIELAERAEAPTSPPQAVSSTTPSEAVSPTPETHGDPIPAGVPTESSGTPPGSIPAEVPSEPISSGPPEQVDEKSKESVEPAVTSSPPETSEVNEAQKSTGEHRSEKTMASPNPPVQPVETRNA